MIEKPTRVVIVDDEPPCRQRLIDLLAHEPAMEIVAECGDGEAAIRSILELRPDLVLLDVQMPQITGFDVVEAIGAADMPAVIFVTAYDEFAVKAFEANAVDYLLKPFSDERFRSSLERFRQRRAAEQRHTMAPLVASALQRAPERFIVRSGNKYDIVQAADVDWFEAADNYVKLHMGEQVRIMRSTISALEARLDPQRFIRIHRSTIVNAARIRRVEPHNQTEFALHLADGTKVTSSRAYRQNVRAFLSR